MRAPAASSAAATRRILMLAFGTIVVAVVATQAVRFESVRSVNRKVGDAIDNALESVRLLGGLSSAAEHWRVIVGRQLLDGHARAVAARELDEARAKLVETSRAYDPLAVFPGERLAWERLQRDLVNVDATARRIVSGAPLEHAAAIAEESARVDAQFESVERDIALLVEINHSAASDLERHIRHDQRHALITSMVLSGIAVVVTLLTAMLVIPMVTGRQVRVEEHAQALERRNRELDAFAGRVAHDLRGPLTAVTLSAGRLADRVPQEEGAAAILQRGVKRMESLIEDLLTLSRVDAELPGTALADQVGPALESALGPRVQEAGGSLRIALEPAEVRCSEGLLYQVLWNLCENALKYRRREVALELAVEGERVDGTYQVRVTDNGRGMSRAEVRQACEPFFRGTESRDTPGTGLGLSIVKRVVDAAGGSLSITSQPGAGTTVEISLVRINA